MPRAKKPEPDTKPKKSAAAKSGASKPAAGKTPAGKAAAPAKPAAKAGAAKASVAKTVEKPVKKSAAKAAAKTSTTLPAAKDAAAKKTAAAKAATDDASAAKSAPRAETAKSRAAASKPARAKDEAAAQAKAPEPGNGAGDSAAASAQFPPTGYAVVEKLLVAFVASEVGKIGLTRVVLGLSGGVDSAVAAAIAARALGGKNVLGIMMPYQTSSPESLADATAVAESLGIETMTVEITTQIDAYFSAHPDASRLRRGNKMARERMTILYDESAARSALVVGTSNKTELLLGYGTLYGDMASALNPIGDLYKTQVWGLARHLGLPPSVIEKAPTADLWNGQTDENELGFSYHEVDRLLYWMIDERCSFDELEAMGFERAFTERIARMIRRSQFKRRLPLIAKISARTVDPDFRYSRDLGL